MAYRPISGTVPQYTIQASGTTASGYWLKFYNQGDTSSSLPMGVNDTPTSTLAKCTLNSLGQPISNSLDPNSRFIPHLNARYDAWLFPTEADADANNTASGIQVADNVALAGIYIINAEEFGIVGDGITDNNTAIDNALTEWASIEGATLVFGDGVFVDSGNHIVDLGNKEFNSIICYGSIKPTNASGICWQITGAENLSLDLRLNGGGVLGDFTNATPVGGSTFLELHTIRWGKVTIESSDFAGRVVHFTAGGTDQATRCRMMDIDIKTGNRTVGAGDVLCGQAFYADSANCVQVGAFGKISWRGEGSKYGPVFERLNDIDITNIEAGKFEVTGPEVRGCVNVYGDTIFLGESDATAGANTSTIKFIQTGAARLCSQIYIDKISCLNATSGVYCADFDDSKPGLEIGSLQAENSDIAIEISNMSEVTIGKLSGSDLINLVKSSGTCGDIDITISTIGAVTGDVVDIDSTHDSFKLSGAIRGGASGFSLIDLAGNEPLDMIDLIMDSSVCTQMLNIQYGGQTSIRHIGGKVSGTSAVYTSGRRPEYIQGVKGHQTYACGDAVILNGNTSVVVNTGLDETVQVANAIGSNSSEVASIYFSSISGANVTFNVATAVTADRTIYWEASSVLLRGDIDA